MTNYDEILRQHRRIRDLLARLPGMDRPDEGRFSELRALLADHFAAEEAGGYLAGLLTDRPDLHGRADALQRQHAEILQMIDDLPGQDVASGVRTLVALVERHESEENQLALDAAGHDLGVGD